MLRLLQAHPLIDQRAEQRTMNSQQPRYRSPIHLLAALLPLTSPIALS